VLWSALWYVTGLAVVAVGGLAYLSTGPRCAETAWIVGVTTGAAACLCFYIGFSAR